MQKTRQSFWAVHILLTVGSFAACLVSVQAQVTNELSVCSFNIRYANPTDTLIWEDRKNEVADAVRYFDVMGLQEVLPIQWDDLRERLSFHDSYGIGREADGHGEACPIFWNRGRFDFLHGEVRWFSETPDVPGSISYDADLPRIVTVVVLYDRFSNRTLRFLNTHWSHVSEEARMSASALLSGWSGWGGAADLTVVCGDFNAEPGEESIENLMSTANLQDTYDAATFRCRRDFGTFPSFYPDRVGGAPRIDYIFYRGEGTVDWICADEYIKYGVYISDHLPIHAIFKIPVNP